MIAHFLCVGGRRRTTARGRLSLTVFSCRSRSRSARNLVIGGVLWLLRRVKNVESQLVRKRRRAPIVEPRAGSVGYYSLPCGFVARPRRHKGLLLHASVLVIQRVEAVQAGERSSFRT